MKKITGVVLLAVIALSSCKKNDEFSINGKIENAGNIKKVLLYEADQIVDSAFLNTDNEFRFRRVAPDPEFYTLAIEDRNFLIIAQNGEEIVFTTNLKDSANAYTIKGSEDSEKIMDFNVIVNKYNAIYKTMGEEYDRMLAKSPTANDSILNILKPELKKNMDAFADESIKFGEANKDNLAGFYAVSSITEEEQTRVEPQMIKYAEDIKPTFPKNKSVQSFVNRMEQIKTVSVGQTAPDFELATPDNKMIKLSDVKAKYVLLDFWASWCAPCRLENPNIVKQYNSFKEKGFTVLSVSLDQKREDWLKAIKDDHLTWTHVSELKYWEGRVNQLYRIEAIPASFVLDQNKKIVAKNLHGADLEDFLKKNLN